MYVLILKLLWTPYFVGPSDGYGVPAAPAIGGGGYGGNGGGHGGGQGGISSGYGAPGKGGKGGKKGGRWVNSVFIRDGARKYFLIC